MSGIQELYRDSVINRSLKVPKYKTYSFRNLAKINSDFQNSFELIKQSIMIINENEEAAQTLYKGSFSMLTSLLDFYLHQIVMCVNLPLLEKDPDEEIPSKMEEIQVSFKEYLKLYYQPSTNKDSFRNKVLEENVFKETLQGNFGIVNFSRWIGIEIKYGKGCYFYVGSKRLSPEEKNFISCINKYERVLRELRNLRNPGAHQFFVNRKTMKEYEFTKESITTWCNEILDFQNSIHIILESIFEENGERK